MSETQVLQTTTDLPDPRFQKYHRGMEQLVTAVQELSLARNLETVTAIVRKAARELTGADGATFVLREGEHCYYADENAIAPLWKGRRFPLSACVSGWAMLNRQQVVIEDIYVDPRIPQDAYRETFVKSLAMVPIRTMDPIGAIGNYWANRHVPTAEDVKLLQALADTTAVALENVRVYEELEQRVRHRTTALELANKELEAFSYAVSHDLRAPLRHIEGFAKILLEDFADNLSEEGRGYLSQINRATQRMGQIIKDLLALSRSGQIPVVKGQVDLSQMAQEIISHLKVAEPNRQIEYRVADGLDVNGDANLLRIALENLLSNAWKFTSKSSQACIEVGLTRQDGQAVYFVRDNGAGFDMSRSDKLFGAFQRLHSEKDFPGTGIGLATVQRVIHSHGGRIWAESAVNQGTTFYFTLG